MMLAPVRIQDSIAWHRYSSTLRLVASELEVVQQRHGGPLGELPPDEETHLLQICYVMAMYESAARGSFEAERNSPLRSLKDGAGWRAHLNRVSDWDVGILQVLVVPAIELFAPLVDQRIIVGPEFSDSHLVDGADGDLIVNGNVIEIKCEAPGFRATARPTQLMWLEL
jgi:hypothetical protein